MTTNSGTCPVCAGTCRMPCPDAITRDYGLRNGWYGYDRATDTVHCDNCGNQYQFSKPSGVVRLNKEGKPCKHEYKGTAGPWRCTHNYDCIHCGDHYMIDSGD